MAEEEEEEQQCITPPRSDFGESGFQPYTLDLHAGNLGGEGQFHNCIGRDDPAGLSFTGTARISRFSQSAWSGNFCRSWTLLRTLLQSQPKAIESRTVVVSLVDFSKEVLSHITPVANRDGLVDIMLFD